MEDVTPDSCRKRQWLLTHQHPNSPQETIEVPANCWEKNMFYHFLLELSAFFRELKPAGATKTQARPSDMCERAQPMAPAVKSVPKSFLWHGAVFQHSHMVIPFQGYPGLIYC